MVRLKFNIFVSVEQTPTEQEKPEWLVKAEQRKPLNEDQVQAITAPNTFRRRDDEDEDVNDKKRPFNEEEFLAGNVPLLRGPSDPSMRLPPRGIVLSFNQCPILTLNHFMSQCINFELIDLLTSFCYGSNSP